MQLLKTLFRRIRTPRRPAARWRANLTWLEDRVQRGQEQVAAAAGLVTAPGDVAVELDLPSAPVPAGRGRAEQVVDGVALGLRRLGLEQMDVHAAILTSGS